MLKKIALEESVGKELSHDITEIRPGEFKGPAFKKGHKVCDEDLCHLQRLGKNHLYLIDLEKDEIHENKAATMLAGEHITKTDLAFLGHGGLCRECPECHYPNCTFGKGM